MTKPSSSDQPGQAMTDQFFCHFYAKACRDRIVFRESADNLVFLALLKQYLRLQRLVTGLNGHCLVDRVELLAYLIRPKNFQLLLSSRAEPDDVNCLIKAVVLSYEGYFGRKYRNREPLFYDVYKSTKISDIQIAVELSQAFHRDCLGWQESSRDYYLGELSADWISCQRLLQAAGGKSIYRRQVAKLATCQWRPRYHLLDSLRKPRLKSASDNLLVDNFLPDSSS